MFKPIIRATREVKNDIYFQALKVADEYDYTFTGNIEANKHSAYSVEFTSDDDCPFYGWAIASTEPNTKGDIDIVFGSGQPIFDGSYVLTDEDYHETIGAGV